MISTLKCYYRKFRRYYRCCTTPINNIHTLSEFQKSKKQVIFLLHETQRGGAPMLGKHIIRQLVEFGYSVLIVALEPGRMLPDFLNLGFVYLSKSTQDLDRFLKKNNLIGIEKAYCNSVLTGKYVPVLKKHGIHVVSLIHEMRNLISKRRECKTLSILLTYSDAIIFPSSVVKESILRLSNSLAIDQRKLFVRPQGLYLTTVRDVNKEKAKKEIAIKYLLDDNKPLIINVASAIHRKGLDIFLKAASLDKCREYLWVGFDSKEFAQSCLSSVGGSLKNFHGVGYISSPLELEQIYEAADILALTSREEPFGSIVLEAFSFATPVVAFDGCGGFVDIVKTGETGCLATEISEQSLIHAIDALCNIYDMSQIRQNCQNKAREMNFPDYVKYLLRL